MMFQVSTERTRPKLYTEARTEILFVLITLCLALHIEAFLSRFS